jgi:hypothetical protein
VSAWLLRVFRLGWADLEPQLVEKLGAAGNVARIGQAYDYLQEWIAEGDGGVFHALQDLGQPGTTPQLVVSGALTAGVNAVVTHLVAAAVAFVAEKFVVPGVGLLTSVYETAKWVFGSLQQFQGLARIATAIVGQIDNVVAGQTDALRGLVRDFLNGLIPVGINFLAGQLKLATLPRDVKGAMERARDLPQLALNRALGQLKAKAGGALGLAGRPQRQGLLVKPVLYKVAGERHLLWAVAQSGRPVVMRAPVLGPGRQAPPAGQRAGSAPAPVRTASDLCIEYRSLDLRHLPEAQRARVEDAWGALGRALQPLYAAALGGRGGTPAQLAPGAGGAGGPGAARGGG